MGQWPPMDQLTAMRVFSRVVESGGFAAAAAKLGLSTTATSRHVADLEAHLRTRLLNRTTRRISLTETGRAFYERTVQMLADLDEAEQEAGQAAVLAHGTIRFTTSVVFGVRHAAPAIAAFTARHPEVRFEASLSDRSVDIVEEGFDLALRVGTLGTDNLVARKLGETRILACAAPAYIAARGEPQVPEDLRAHNCLAYEYENPRGQWRFHDAAGRDHSVRIAGNVLSNNGYLLSEAAAQGAGIVYAPEFIVGAELRDGRLVALLPNFVTPRLPLYALYPSRKHLSAKIRVFVEFLVERFAQSPDWQSAAR